MKPEYRGDIDGLRAIAVLLVVAFHAFPRHAPGGFIGVDIFFVISGFLISRLIYNDLRDGTFSLLEFYSRRIKRIFPALIVVLLACAVVGSAVLFPDEYQSLGKHIAGGAGFVSNFLLLSEVGYFDQAAENKPLLHLWSLGIEEQFYLVWPAVILLCARWKKDPFSIAAIICIVSFAWNVALSTTNPSAAFYLPVTRFWELMIGCMLASLTSKRGDDGRSALLGMPWLRHLDERQRRMMAQAAPWLGVALIVLSAIVIDRDRTFPGWWALLPTIGTALLIGVAPAGSIVRGLLSNRVLVYIGLISYPLYLWHWPILSFARIVHISEPRPLVKLAAVVVAFALAALTYRFIERPVRFGMPTSFKPIAALSALSVVGCVGALVYVNAGFPLRYSPELQTAIRSPFQSGDRGCEHGFTKEQSKFDSTVCHAYDHNSARRIVLWGDSHAAYLSRGFEDALQRLGNLNVITAVSVACPPIVSFTSMRRPDCRAFNDHVIQRIETWKPDTVVMVARWDVYRGTGGLGTVAANDVRSTIARLNAMGVERVVVVGQFPVWYATPWRIRARLLRLEPVKVFAGAARAPLPTRDKHYLQAVTYEADERIRQAVIGTSAVFISPPQTFCNEGGCLLVLRSDSENLVGEDAHGHLTPAGAIYFTVVNSKSIFGR